MGTTNPGEYMLHMVHKYRLRGGITTAAGSLAIAAGTIYWALTTKRTTPSSTTGLLLAGAGAPVVAVGGFWLVRGARWNRKLQLYIVRNRTSGYRTSRAGLAYRF